MSRIEQVNELIRSELANLINQEVVLNNCLITVCYVNCSPDLSSAKIGISVLPDKYSNLATKELKKNSSQFTNILKKKTKLRRIPRFNWEIDLTEKNATEVEKLLEQIKREEE